jgi:glycosyltransferase involved in cell wall biosynthesis
MIKIAYIIDSLSFGGAERQLSLLVRALPDPFSPLVISLSEEIHPFGEQLRSDGIDVIALPRHSGIDVLRLSGTVRALHSHRADIVHGFLDAANAYAFTSGRFLRKPVVLSLRNELLRVRGARATVLTWMLRHAARVLVNSSSGAEHLRTAVGVDEQKILHIPNWIDPKRMGHVREIPPPGTPPTIGFVGRFARQKRLDILLDSFKQVLDTMPDARLILMGGGSEHGMVTTRIRDLGIAGRVEIIEPNPDVDATLRQLHIFVMTSDFEGLPNAAMEALSMGIPIVSTPVGDIRELVVEGQTGMYLDKNDPGSVSDTLVRALTDRTLLERSLTAGPKLIEEKFSLARAVERLSAVYHEILG